MWGERFVNPKPSSNILTEFSVIHPEALNIKVNKNKCIEQSTGATENSSDFSVLDLAESHM